MYEALSYWCMRPEATGVCLKLRHDLQPRGLSTSLPRLETCTDSLQLWSSAAEEGASCLLSGARGRVALRPLLGERLNTDMLVPTKK